MQANIVKRKFDSAKYKGEMNIMRNINVKYNKEKIWATIEKHLKEDYRDPQQKSLPPIGSVIEDSIVCIPNIKKEDSIKEVTSETAIWDTMRNMGLSRKRLGKTFIQYKNRQREFIFNHTELCKRDFRRLTMPASQYVLLELKEDGYDYAKRKLKKLMYHHDKMRNSIPPEQIKDKPLKNMPNSIIFLGEVLKQANIYKTENDKEKESSLYFYIARHYEIKERRHWTWLANQFYKLAVETVNHVDADSGYSKALINYMYGRYLLLKEKDAPQARERLQTAFTISEGKPWGAMWATNISFEKINEYSSYLLHIAQLLTAQTISNIQPEKAVEYSVEAVRHARRGNWHPDLEEAMLDLAINYTKNKQHEEAISILVQLSGKVRPKENKDMYLSIQVLLALCYKRARRKDEAIKQLFFLVEVGREWSIPELVAFGHKNISRYLIEKDQVVTARQYLESCILLYRKEQNYKELIESVYLHGCCKAKQHIKQYIELMIEASTPDNPGFKKILDFLSYGKPFWEVKTMKKYVVTKTVRPLLTNKKILTASDKVYLILKNKFGERFADYAMEEITAYGKKPLAGDYTNYLLDDPTEFQLFNTRDEAGAYKHFLKEKYEGKNNMLKKLYEQEICFEIEEREVDDTSEEHKYIKRLNTIDPLIPYEKDSPMYKQALELRKYYSSPSNVAKPKTVYIDVTNPKILIRLLNTMVESGNVVFKFQGSINFDAILQEMIKQRKEQQMFVESLPKIIEERYSTEIPQRPLKPTTPPPDEIIDGDDDYDYDEYIEQNRDILFNTASLL